MKVIEIKYDAKGFRIRCTNSVAHLDLLAGDYQSDDQIALNVGDDFVIISMEDDELIIENCNWPLSERNVREGSFFYIDCPDAVRIVPVPSEEIEVEIEDEKSEYLDDLKEKIEDENKTDDDTVNLGGLDEVLASLGDDDDDSVDNGNSVDDGNDDAEDDAEEENADDETGDDISTEASIQMALDDIDHDNEDHWTQGGMPSMAYIEEYCGDEAITRKMVNAVQEITREIQGDVEEPKSE